MGDGTGTSDRGLESADKVCYTLVMLPNQVIGKFVLRPPVVFELKTAK
jgi:hypothetical protein